MTLQERIDALADDRQWSGGWYQPIEFPGGARTHSTKMADEQFYGSESRGLLKWERVIRPHLGTLRAARFMEIGCNAGLFLAQARKEGAAFVCGVENHPQFVKQARLVLGELCPEAVLIEGDALSCGWMEHGPFDVALLANALYWMVYSDERGFLPDCVAKLSAFLEALARATEYILVIGAECPLRYANLETAVPVLAEHFEILKAEPLRVNDRALNIIVGRSLVADSDRTPTRCHAAAA